MSSALALTMSLLAAAVAQARVEISPAQPTTDDTITVRCIIDTSETDCVPWYECSTWVAYEAEFSYPANMVIYAGCVGNPPPRGQPCHATPTEYGPEFRIGPLPRGTHRITLPGSTSPLATIDVAPSPTSLTVGGVVLREAYGRPGLGGSRVVLSRLDGPGAPQAIDSAIVLHHYEFTRLAPGNYRLTCAAAFHQTREVDLHVDTHMIVSPSLLRDSAMTGIHGTVSGNRGQVILPGCTVSVRGVGSPLPDPAWGVAMVTDSAGEFSSGPVTMTYSNLLSVVSVRAPGLPPVDRLVVLVDYGTRLDFILDTLARGSNVASVEYDGLVYRLTAWSPWSWNPDGSGPGVFRILYTVVNVSGAPRRLEFPYLCTSPECWDESIVSEALVSSVTGPAGEPLQVFSILATQCGDAWTSIMLAPGDSIAMARPPASVADFDTVTVCAHLPGYDPQSAMCVGVRFREAAAVQPGPAQPAPAPARSGAPLPVYDLRGRSVPAAGATAARKPGVYVDGASRRLVVTGEAGVSSGKAGARSGD